MLLSVLEWLTVVALLAVEELLVVPVALRLPWCSGMMLACASKIDLCQVSNLFHRQCSMLAKWRTKRGLGGAIHRRRSTL